MSRRVDERSYPLGFETGRCSTGPAIRRRASSGVISAILESFAMNGRRLGPWLVYEAAIVSSDVYEAVRLGRLASLSPRAAIRVVRNCGYIRQPQCHSALYRAARFFEKRRRRNFCALRSGGQFGYMRR